MFFYSLIGQLGRIVVAAEVAQPDIAEVAAVVGCKEIGCLLVANMSASRGDALFEVIGVVAGAEHLFVVITFDDKVVGLGEIGDHFVG